MRVRVMAMLREWVNLDGVRGLDAAQRGSRFNPLRYNLPPARSHRRSRRAVESEPKPAAPKPVVLLILDGWGHRDDPTDNALAQADCRTGTRLLATRPHTLIHTEGRHVGLPDGQMGNSEVGHMNLGAGRIVYQDLTRIDAAIEDGSFFANPELRRRLRRGQGERRHPARARPAVARRRAQPRRPHLRDARLARREGVPHGRRARVPRRPRHAAADRPQPSLRTAAGRVREGSATRASPRVSGRYYAMDRDKRWDRVRRAWDAIVEATTPTHRAHDALAALRAAYARGENDEFVAPTVIARRAPMRDGDAVVFMNFRADRARQLTAAFVSPALRRLRARAGRSCRASSA